MRISDWSQTCALPISAEGRPFKMHVEQREGELQRDEDAGGEGGDTPEGRGDHEGADDILDIGGSGGRAARTGWGGGVSGHGTHHHTPPSRAPHALTHLGGPYVPGNGKQRSYDRNT